MNTFLPSRNAAINGITLLLILMISGCDLVGFGRLGVHVRTDTRSYTADPASVIELSAKNNRRTPVYYICTGDIFLEELQGRVVTRAWQMHGFEECGAIVPIHPGASVSFDLSLDPEHLLRFVDARFDGTATYRLRLELYEGRDLFQPDGDELIDVDERRSNRFELAKE